MRLAPIMYGLGISALALALSACDSGPSVSATNATPAEVQEQVDAAGGAEIMVNPGRWEGTMTIHEMAIPGTPPEVMEQMKSRMGAAQNFVSCVTEEDVKEQKAFFTGDPDDKSCKYEHFTMAAGKVSAELKCDRGAEGRMAMTMDGSYSPDSYRMNMSSRAEGNGPMGAMTMKMTVDAKRVGVCKGTDDES